MFDFQPVVLIIEDDANIRRFVRQALESEGCVVHEADTVKRGLIEAGTRQPDAIVLDLGLPDEDGMTLIRELRGWTEVPVLVLSARSAEADKVAALDAGADDYLAKPCDPRELTARLRAVLRRTHPAQPSAQMQLGDLSLNLTRGVAQIDGQEISLTLSESRILEALLRQPGEPLDKQALAQLALGRKLTLYDRSLDMHVSNLRKKLGSHPDGSPRILALRGRGYYYSH